MTVAAMPSSIDYVEDGVTLSFALPFKFKAGSIVATRVLASGTVQTLGPAEFSTSGGTTDGGGSALLVATVAGARLRFRRATPRVQAMNYTAGDRFPAESHEGVADIAMLIDQEQDAKIDSVTSRALVAPDGDTAAGMAGGMTLPSLAVRGDSVLGFDTLGRPMAAFKLSAIALAIANATAALANQSVSDSVVWLQSGAGATTTTVADKFRRDFEQSVRDRGATGIDTDNARPAFAACDAIGAFVVPKGRYTIASDLTLASGMTMLAGARLIIPTGVTLTINGAFDSPQRGTRFECQGTGKVSFGWEACTFVCPEWWGARINVPGTDCLPALHAAFAAHYATDLLAGDYWCYDTLNIARSGLDVRGRSVSGNGTLPATRIVLNGAATATKNVGLFGTNVLPPSGAIDDFLSYMRMSNITFVRYGTPNFFSDHSQSPRDLRIYAVVRCQIDNVYVTSYGCIGISVGAAVYTKITNCTSTRFRDASANAHDFWWPWYLEGYPIYGPVIGGGGNASLYIDRCAAGREFAGTPPGGMIGVNIVGAFTDTFITWMETQGFQTAFSIAGPSVLYPTSKSSDSDLHIIHPVLDAFTSTGFDISNLSRYASVSIVDPYITPALGALAAIYAHDTLGSLTITGGEAICWGDAQSGGTALGILGINCSGLSVSQLKITGANRPVGMQNSRNFDLDVIINNPDTPTGNAAVALTNCARGFVSPKITDPTANLFTAGVSIDAASSHIEVHCSKINPGALTVAANKLVYNGVAATVANVAVGTGILPTGWMS